MSARALRITLVALTLLGVGVATYLTGREVFSIHHICEWCLSSAAIITLLMCLSIWRFLRGGQPAGDAPAEPRVSPAEPATPLEATRP